jgi:NAD dependent epimerase/dehydratase family enzyme
MTIELLKMLFGHKHEVLIFLRSISKSSESFMNRFYEEEIQEHFSIYQIEIKVPLISDVVKTNEFEEDQKNEIMTKLTGFNNLQKIDEFSNCF